MQASLLGALAKLKDKKDEAYFNKQLSSQSYNVQGAALRALAAVQPTQALSRAKTFETNAQGAVAQAVTEVYAKNGGLAEWAYVRDKFDEARPQGKFNLVEPLAGMMSRLDDPAAFNEGVTRLRDLGMKYKQFSADKYAIKLLGDASKAQTGRVHAAENQAAAAKAVAELQAGS